MQGVAITLAGIEKRPHFWYDTPDMITVKRKDAREANENLLRRFNRRVLQSGVIAKAKAAQRFSKPQSKRERRNAAIMREQRKAEKAMQIRLGLLKSSR